jgi:hypothetical protein
MKIKVASAGLFAFMIAAVSAHAASLSPDSLYGPTTGSSGGSGLGCANGSNISGCGSIATGSAQNRTLAARAADVFNPKNFGAIGDGNVHTISSTLGITTLAGLTGYTVNGTHPYAGLGASPVGNYAALPALQAMSSGATVIPMYSTVYVGGPGFNSVFVASGSTFIPVGSGTAERQAGFAYTVGQIFSSGGTSGNDNLYIITTAGTTANFGVNQTTRGCATDGSAVYCYLGGNSVGMGALKPGMQCSNSAGTMPAGSTIVTINPAAQVIQLNVPTTGSLALNASFSCGYNLNKIAVGAQVTGFNIPPGTTVTAVNNYGINQTITLSQGVTAAETAFTPVEFYSPFTDAQIANATMDWLGIQAAEIAAGASVPTGTTAPNGGGTVFIPNGYYVNNLGIQIPQANEVDTKGSGMGSTVLYWNVDTGPGSCFLNDGFRLTGLNSGFEKFNVIQDLQVLGPSNQLTMGASNVLACGISVNGYKNVDTVQVSQTFAGIANNGGQGILHNLNIYHTYYGVYFDMPDTYANFGDNLFQGVQINGATMADVACSVSYCDPSSTWTRSGFFAAPYGFMTETNGLPNSLAGNRGLIFDHTKFENVQAENIGHAMIGDDRPYGQAVSQALETIWEQFEPYWGANGTFQIANTSTSTSPSGAIFEMGYCNDCEIKIPAESELWLAQSDGVIDILSTTGFNFFGDIGTILAENTTAAVLSNNMNPNNWRFFASGWQGIACFSCGYYPLNQVLAYPAAGAGNIAAATGTAGEQVVGISQGAIGNNAVIATSGVANCVLAAGTNNPNVPLTTAASGKCTQATGSNSATPYIGWTNYGAVSTGSIIPVHLRIGGL